MGPATARATLATALAAVTTRPAATRRRPMPSSKLVIVKTNHRQNKSWCRSTRRDQPIAYAAHGLHDQGIGRITLDLAAQPVDLHVHGSLADALAVAGERLARHGFADAGG